MAELSVPKIETARLLLRQITTEDIDEWGQRIFADPDVLRYLPKRDMTPQARAEWSFGIDQGAWQQYGYGGWLITDKADGQLLGDCFLEPPQELSEVELGYRIAKAYWGKGITTEAARAAVQFGFEHAKLERIVAVVVPENIASWRVLEHIGFVYEKKAIAYDLDVVYYAITPDKFQPGNSFYRLHV